MIKFSECFVANLANKMKTALAAAVLETRISTQIIEERSAVKY